MRSSSVRAAVQRRRVGILVVSVLTAATVAACGSSTPAEEPTAGSGDGMEGVQTYSGLTRNHTDKAVDYPQSPPVGGDHNPVWLECSGTVFDEPVPNENAVHSLEHGAVWITYDDSVSADDVDALATLVDGQPYTFMSPYPGQPSPIMLTAWGVQLGVESADDSRIEEFLTTYRQGLQTPEPGATCESGMMP